MRKAVFAIAALGLATTVAYAQTDNPPPAQPPSPPAAQGDSPSPAGPGAMHGPNGMRGPGRHGPGNWQKHGGMMMGTKAAHFRIRSGDTMIDVKCAADDTTAACGETVMRLLDKLQADQPADEDQGDGDSMMNE